MVRSPDSLAWKTRPRIIIPCAWAFACCRHTTLPAVRSGSSPRPTAAPPPFSPPMNTKEFNMTTHSLTPEQEQVVAHPLGQHARVLAVAGSGKSTTMAHRIRISKPGRCSTGCSRIWTTWGISRTITARASIARRRCPLCSTSSAM